MSTEECTDGHIAGLIIIDSVLGLALANMTTPPEQEKGGVSGPSQAGSAPATYLDALAYRDVTAWRHPFGQTAW